MAGQPKAVPAAPAPSVGADVGPPQMDAPPAFDASLLPPPAISEPNPPPPAFDFVEDDIMGKVNESKNPAPPPEPPVMPSAPPAPSFEDLMDLQTPPPYNPLDGMQPVVAPPTTTPEEEMILGMEGLSDEEKRVLLDEQRRIMDQIETEKAANDAAIAAAQAEAFDSRSTSVAVRATGGANLPTRARMPSAASSSQRKVNLGGGQEVSLHGPEQTKAAIKEGTAVLVQCLNCENLMQVTGNATLMYCPVCAVVSPVMKIDTPDQGGSPGGASDDADRQLAEQLQKEEYERAGQEPRQRRAQRAQTQERTDAGGASSSSWWSTVSNMFSVKMDDEHAASTPAKTQSPQRNDLSFASPPSSGGLTRAKTGQEETVEFSRSRDERDGLLGSSGLPTARVAEKQPLFSCVVDSVSNAANAMGTALTTQTLQEDREGNVHGVDASSLLAVPQVSRETGYRQVPNDA